MWTQPLLIKVLFVLALVAAVVGTTFYRISARNRTALDAAKKGVQAQTDGLKNLKKTLDHYKPK
jgi:hypothetical protein